MRYDLGGDLRVLSGSWPRLRCLYLFATPVNDFRFACRWPVWLLMREECLWRKSGGGSRSITVAEEAAWAAANPYDQWRERCLSSLNTSR